MASVLCVACGYFGLIPVRAAPPVLHPPQAVGVGAWKLTWECDSGATYRLERSFDLLHWTPVNTLTADGSLLSDMDLGVAGKKWAFWRVVQTEEAPPYEFRITSFTPDALQGGWKLTWESHPGMAYRLERSFDLKNWTKVGTIAAISELTSLLDTHIDGHSKVFWRVVQTGLAPPDEFRITGFAPDVVQGGWKLTWESHSGTAYRLERSFDLKSWTEVGTIAAISELTSLLDTRIAGQPKVFWRVKALGNGSEPIVVSSPKTESPTSGGGATWSVVAGGFEPIKKIVFADDSGTEVGEATLGFGGTWSLTIDRASNDPPRSVVLHAEVTGIDGTQVESEPYGIFFADPEKFIPISNAGELQSGQFVEVRNDGTLGAFRYLPEGSTAPNQAVGVYFEFPAGARLVSPGGGTPEIEFASGIFFHGGNVAPSVVGSLAQRSGSTHSLPLGALSPGDLCSAFGLPSGPVNLGWGNELVKWTNGLLAPGGWKNLLVQLPFVDFPLPGGILNVNVVADPKSGECSLAVRCFGEWMPLDAGPLFHIPKSAPLTLRLSETGRFSADGTAEAEFSDGGKIRGSIIWCDPNFEFRFEGKAVVIPVLDRLKGLLPTDPLAATPATSGTNDLNDFSLFLNGCQSSIRGLAKGAGAAAPTSDSQTDAPPAATLADPAGAALEAWSGRIVSWSGDRSGQLLNEDQLQDLTQVIAQSARLGEAAADLPTVLRLLRNLLAMADPLESIRGTGEISTALADAVADAESRLIAAARRIAAKKTLDAKSGEMAETAALLGKIAALVESLDPKPAANRSPVPARGNTLVLRDSFAKLAADCRSAVPSDIFARMGILSGDTTGTDNASLGALDADALLNFLCQIAEMFEIQRAGDNGTFNIESLNGSTPPLYEAWRQIRDVYPDKESELAWPAMLAHDFGGIRKTLARRARYFKLNARLGSPLSCNDPELGLGTTSPISTDALIDAFLAEQQKRSGAMLAESCGDDLHSLDTIVSHTTDGRENSHLTQAIFQASGCLALLGRDNGSAAGCSPVYLALVEAGLHPDDPPLDSDTPRTLRVTGEYENLSTNSPITLQINQAGRLLLGRIQFHGLGTRKTYRERIVGMLKSETADTAVFHILRRRENGSILGGEIVYPGLLVITRTSSGMNLEVRPLPGNTGAPVAFIKTTNIPSGSGVLTDLFTGEAQEIFLARQFSPLHSSQITAVRDQAQPVIDQIAAYLATAGQSTPMRNAAAAQIAAALDAVFSHVTVDQVPLARQITREMLNRTNISEGTEKLSAWSWLRVIFSRHKNNPGFNFQTFRDFMGAEIDSQFSGNAFEYTIHIEEIDYGIGFEMAGGIGATLLEITITKQRADGSGTNQTFKLQGAIGQLSAGLSIGDLLVTGGSGSDDITVYSDIDYTATMLAGPIGYLGLTVAAGIKITDISYGPAMLSLFGDSSAPAFSIPLSLVSSGGDHQIPPTVQISAGFGSLTAWDDMSPGDLSLSAEPEDLSFTNESSEAGSVQFDVDSSTLRHCGEANLRMLVAEMRSVFGNTNSVVSILGFTDATGTDAHNLALSQARAESVKVALIALVGEGLAVPFENIHAIGLGRQPAMGLTSPNESLLNCLEAQFLDRKKLALGVLDDGEADPKWRSVTIILNNLVSIDLGTP